MGGQLKGVSTASGVKRSGIAIAGQSMPQILRNRIANNGGYGILVKDTARPTLEDNMVTGSAHTAVVFQGSAGGTLKGNNISSNDGYGLDISDSADPSIE